MTLPLRFLRRACLAVLLACLLTLSGCVGGHDIENCLFVLAMAIDPAPDGNLIVTVKALSGSQGGSSSAGRRRWRQPERWILRDCPGWNTPKQGRN